MKEREEKNNFRKLNLLWKVCLHNHRRKKVEEHLVFFSKWERNYCGKNLFCVERFLCIAIRTFSLLDSTHILLLHSYAIFWWKQTAEGKLWIAEMPKVYLEFCCAVDSSNAAEIYTCMYADVMGQRRKFQLKYSQLVLTPWYSA